MGVWIQDIGTNKQCFISNYAFAGFLQFSLFFWTWICLTARDQKKFHGLCFLITFLVFVQEIVTWLKAQIILPTKREQVRKWQRRSSVSKRRKNKLSDCEVGVEHDKAQVEMNLKAFHVQATGVARTTSVHQSIYDAFSLVIQRPVVCLGGFELLIEWKETFLPHYSADQHKKMQNYVNS